MKRLTSSLSLLLLFAFAQIALAQTPTAQIPITSQSQENSPRQKRGGAITGHVIGVDGRPMADAQIYARKISEKPGPGASTASDDEGNFQLTGLSLGTYYVNAYAPGYVSTDISWESNLHRIGENLTLNLVKGGVITGRVTDETGEPLVGVFVYSQYLRDSEGKRVGSRFTGDYGSSAVTDDRGIYRIFGLRPGIYIVGIRSGGDYGAAEPLIRYEAPTFYPSAVRDTATEINVGSGEEITGVDIRHRGERGHIVSGVWSGEPGSQPAFNFCNIYLRGIENTQYEMSSFINSARGFVIEGVPDGEYELSATAGQEENETFSAIPRRVSVKGADVSGIELKMAPHGSIAGRVLIESSNPPKKCRIEEATPGVQSPGQTQDQTERQRLVDEILLKAARDDANPRATRLPFGWEDTYGRAPNEKGEFALKGLEVGRYRIVANLPDDGWYLSAIRLIGQTSQIGQSSQDSSKSKRVAGAGTGASKSAADPSRDGVSIKPGEKVSGVDVLVSDGAAGLKGRVIPAKSEAKLPPSLRAHLIPAETASGDDALRYAEVEIQSDGSFEFKHIAPGRYWLLARPGAETDLTTGISRFAAWDANERAKLRRDATVTKNEVELAPCGRMTDYILRFNP